MEMSVGMTIKLQRPWAGRKHAPVKCVHAATMHSVTVIATGSDMKCLWTCLIWQGLLFTLITHGPPKSAAVLVNLIWHICKPPSLFQACLAMLCGYNLNFLNYFVDFNVSPKILSKTTKTSVSIDSQL